MTRRSGPQPCPGKAGYTDLQGNEAAWERLIEGWNADEFHFLQEVAAGDLLGATGARLPCTILTVWWD
jgi:hypothetical protein